MRLALLCPDLTGHLNPMTTLGVALRDLGHRVTLCGLARARRVAERAGLEFRELGLPETQSGELNRARDRLATLRGLAAVRCTASLLKHEAQIMLRDAPDVLRQAGIEGAIVDQVSPAGFSAASALNLPFAIVCNALAINMEPAVPPVFTTWSPDRSWLARTRNRCGNWLLQQLAGPVFREVNAFRRRHGLPEKSPGCQDYGELLQLAQQPAFLDFPRTTLPDNFHYTGPWHHSGRDEECSFPWERLDGRPLVYASLGTLQNQIRRVFVAILTACRDLDVQLVLSLGSRDATLDVTPPPGALIVPYAPQLALLRRASAVVTHAGLNTALESLACGVPMLAIPITNDQPGVARRLERLGCARLVSLAHATSTRLRTELTCILQDPRYRQAAHAARQAIGQGPNVQTAAQLIHAALTTGRRLRREDAASILASPLKARDVASPPETCEVPTA